MQIAGIDAHIAAILGQVFGHALGKGGHQHPLLAPDAFPAFSQQVFHLSLGGTQLHFRVHQPRGPDDLLGNDALGLVHLVFARCGRNVDHLMQQGTELVELQGTVVQGRGQAETIIHKGLLARAVAFEHAAHLRHGDVGLVHEQDEILGEIVEQAGRRFPGLAAVQMAGIILDAVAVAQLLDHLQIKLCPLLQTLRLHQAPAGLEGRQPFQQLLPDVGRGPLKVVLGGNEVTGRIDDGLAHFRQHVPGQGIHLAHGVDVIPKNSMRKARS